ncbi:MAG: hypothetical protein E6G07_01225 [Actinobacteria bacterium]|nr:MAG: hypothetical protein E6G07_01225 [Actinomycetota bacterium]
MRARAVFAVLAAGAFGAAPGSAAAARFSTVEFSPSGAITVAWHGDRAAGCEGAGMCGYSGSISYGRIVQADLELMRTRRGRLDVSGNVYSDGPAVVRARREVPGAAPAVCVATGDAPFFNLDVSPAYRGRKWFSLGAGSFPPPIASGQCAGPRLADFQRSMPAAAARLGRLKRRGSRLSLAGRFPFRAGALSGTVISTVVLRSQGVRKESDRGGGGGPGGGSKTVEVDLRFRVRRGAGEVAADFRAVEAPVCQVLDACGATGREAYAIAGAGGVIDVSGFAAARGRRIPSLRAAIAAVARGGDVEGEGQIGPSSGITSILFQRPGSASCTDRFRPPAPLLFMEGFGKRFTFDLTTPDSDVLTDSLSDVFRGRCPGPSQADILGGAALASVRLETASLAHRKLRAVLSGSGRFSSGAYAGDRSGRVVLDLVRTRARVRVVKG